MNMKRGIMLLGMLLSWAMMMWLPAEENMRYAIGIAFLMMVFWMFEVVPIYVTALLPLVLAVPLGVLDVKALSQAYGHRLVFLFFGGFVLSLALEKWDVHKQIASFIIRVVGTSKSRILFGFSMATALLSMWISNTATALMMLPMALAVIDSLPAASEKNSKFPRFLLLTVAYSASLGGMATLVGSPPNAAMAAILESSYGMEVDFMDWMKIGLPLSVAMLCLLFGFFMLLMGAERAAKIEGFRIEKKKWTTDQKRVMILFLGIVVLWSFKKHITQWTGIHYGDEIPAVLGAILLFVLPGKEKGKTLLDWKDTARLPWGILLLFGGGLALAKMLETNGIIAQLSQSFQGLHGVSIYLILFVLVGISIYGTEVMSNLALVTVFVPVVAALAPVTGYSVMQLCIPVTLAASCAFMLPVGTPPNAIVFSSGRLRIGEMARVGFVLNLIGAVVVVLFSLLLLET